MVTNFVQRLSRRRLSCLAIVGLCWLPACSTPGRVQSPADHVFSTVSPCDLDARANGQALPAKAAYPSGSPSGQTVSAAAPEPPNAAERSAVLSGDMVSAGSSAEGVVRIAAPYRTAQPELVLTAAREDTASGPRGHGDYLLAVAPTGAQSGLPSDCEILPDGRVFTPADPRCDPGMLTGPLNCPDNARPCCDASAYPDEYICDGGDRGLPIHYYGEQRRGLETEDTVVEYSDHAGEFQVRASNQVCIYAPRFGSVRAITGQETDIKLDRAAGATDAMIAGNFNSGMSAVQNVQGDNPLQLLDRRRADGVELSLPPSEAVELAQANQNRKIDHGLLGRAVTGASAFDRFDNPVVAELLQNAIIWTRDQYPVIAASTSSATEVVATFRLRQTVGVEDERKPGIIRIVKLADRAMAQSGDTVAFEIRFQNTGDFPLYDVRIVDNLTPRLEYVSGSGTIDDAHPGDVVVEPNGEGSHLLTFELDGPLPPNSSGTIRFAARVR